MKNILSLTRIAKLGPSRHAGRFKGLINAGLLGQHRVVIFKNELKEKDKEPDYHILLSDPPEAKAREPSQDDDFIA